MHQFPGSRIELTINLIVIIGASSLEEVFDGFPKDFHNLYWDAASADGRIGVPAHSKPILLMKHGFFENSP